jgi:hypothetical protein
MCRSPAVTCVGCALLHSVIAFFFNVFIIAITVNIVAGLEHPLIQAPMSGSTPPALVAAVSNAGGLGSLGAGYLEPQAILDQAAQIRALSDRRTRSACSCCRMNSRSIWRRWRRRASSSMR